MIPKLFVSGSREEIKKQIELILTKFSISPFDIFVLGQNSFSTKIGEIRDLKQKLELKPFQGVKKATIIYNAEGLTAEAQNASLKILEEPPEDTVIILCTSNENLLLPTIISRCEIVRLKFKARNTKLESNSKNTNSSYSTFSNLVKMDIGERLALAEDLCKKQNKDEPLEVVRKRVEEWLDNLIKEMQSQTNLNNLNSSLLAKKQIKQNLNIRLVLENFFLNL